MSSNIGIAISGKSGCGNSTVSGMVAEKLGFSLVNYTFRSMAKEIGIAFDDLRKLAENDYAYDLQLDKKQIALAKKDNSVLASRLAVWLYQDAAFKVYLYASPEKRAKRIHSREGGSYETIYNHTIERDKADQSRYRKIYDIDTSTYSHVDLILNTEYFSAEEEADIIIEALKIRKIID